MASYLDKNGLSRLWDHITNKIDSKSVHNLVFNTKEHLDRFLVDNPNTVQCKEFSINSGVSAGGAIGYLRIPEAGTYYIYVNIESWDDHTNFASCYTQLYWNGAQGPQPNGVYTFTEATDIDIILWLSDSSGTYADNGLTTNVNIYAQIDKGDTLGAHPVYIREDGITKSDLKAGDLLLVEEMGVADYWWDGSSLQALKAYAVDIDIDLVYPADSVYMSIKSTANPAKLFGGTWESITSSITGVYMWKRTA